MLLFAFTTQAQQAENNTTSAPEAIPVANVHSPKKAAIMSMILPGLGQAYNRKFWKIPIVYAGLGASIYGVIWNNQQYNEYSTAFDIREAGGDDKYAGIYSTPNLISLQNFYRNNRDLSVLISVLVYALNILDANIDAHLYNFDVSDDLSLSVQPTMMNGFSQFGQNRLGLHITLNF